MFVFPDQGNEILRYCDHIIEELQQLREQYACDGSLEDETVNCKRLIGQILGDTKQ